MIFSRSRNFIFIKTRKTAGTSLEIALSPLCGPDDVVTPISPDDEIVRLEATGALPRNFLADPAGEAGYRAAIEARDEAGIRAERQRWGTRRFWSHIGAAEVRGEIGEQDWERGFKFAFDRHPYEKAVSAAAYRARGDAGALPAMLEEVIDGGRVRNWDMYAQGERLLVDEVFRYEEIDAARAVSGERLGIGALELPRTKHTYRPGRRPAAEVLTSNQKRRIQELCAVEFEAFGYER